MRRILDPAETFPLRLSLVRFRLYAVGLALMGVAQIVHSGQNAFWDWGTFASAAARVGTTDFLRPRLLQDVFVYMPGAAWALAPLRNVQSEVGFGINAGLMLAAAIAAAATAHRIWKFSMPFCLAMILAWAPTTYSLVVGQNAPLGLLLILLSLLGFTRAAPALTAVPLTLLLYKPTYALPLIGLLVLRKRYRELLIIAIGGVCWYLTSVAATAGDWAWPRTFVRLEHSFFGLDFAHNQAKVIGVTTLLIRFGIPGPIIGAVAALIVAATVPLLTRATEREAYAGACLLGLVVSPHAWNYDAVLALPMIFVGLANLREPERTRVICAAYAIAIVAPFIFVFLGFTPLAILVIGAFLAWFVARSRPVKCPS